MAAYHPRQIAPRPRSPPIASSSSSQQNTDLLFPSASSAELGWSLVYPQRRRSVSASFSSTGTSDSSSCALSPRAELRGLSPPLPIAPLPSSYWHDLGLPAHDGHGNFPSPGITPRASVDAHLGFHRPQMFHRSLSNRTADTYSTLASTDDGLSALDLNDGSEYGWDGSESARNRSEGGSFGGSLGIGMGTGTGTRMGQATMTTDRWRSSQGRRTRDSSPFTTISNSTALSEEREEQEREREQGSVHHRQQLHSRRISSVDSALTLYRRQSFLSSVALAGLLVEPSAAPSSTPTGQSITELLTTSLGSLFQLASSSILSFLPPTELSYKHSISLRAIRTVWNIDEESLMLIFPPPLPPPVEQPVFHELFLEPVSATVADRLESNKLDERECAEVAVEDGIVLDSLAQDDPDDHDSEQAEGPWTRGHDLIFRNPWMPWID